MFCSTCGAEINDMAAVCPNCGCPTAGNAQPVQPQQASYTQPAQPQFVQNQSNAPVLEAGETPGLATAALVCSLIAPIVGLILGIVGAVKYNTPSLKKRCIIAIPLSIGIWALTALLLSAFY